MNNKLDEKKAEQALYKKAYGYTAKEVVEEYQDEDGTLVLKKKKVTSKNVPPDMMALKIVMDLSGDSEKPIEEMTDEELKEEKERLLKMLEETDGEESKD